MKLLVKILLWPVTLLLSLLTCVCAFTVTHAMLLLGAAVTLVVPVALLAMFTTSRTNGVILLAVAFLLSPLGLPMLAVKLLGVLDGLNAAIRDYLNR